MKVVAREFAGKAVVGMSDVDKSKISEGYEVEFLPTTFIIKNGEVAEKIVGPKTEEIKAAINGAL